MCKKKLMIQCDFDGTVLEEDISFSILEKYAKGDWHTINRLYNEGKITVAQFNERAFGLVRASFEEQMEFIRGKERLRVGFLELLKTARDKGIKFVIISNGFEYYIEYILNHLGLNDVEYHGAKVRFDGFHMHINYIDHEGKLLQTGFKDSYTDKFLRDGYEIIYIGDGMSDLSPAKKCQTVFAFASLAERCQKTGVPYLPLRDFNDVVSYINSLALR